MPETGIRMGVELLNRIAKLPLIFQKNLNITRSQINSAKKKLGIVLKDEIKCDVPKRLFPHNI